jgi:hypothetical protein
MNQSAIVEAVAAGRAEFEWVELAPGLFVTRDAVRIDGVRVNVTAETAQKCADLLGASLTTPLLEDMIYEAADFRCSPVLMKPDGSWRQTLGHSVGLDRQIVAQGTRPRLVGAIGKSWVLSNGLADPNRHGRAANYGYHSPSAKHRAVSGNTNVWQPLGFAHNIFHTDYSQTLRLAKGPLPTHEGTLRVFRQPGVPIVMAQTEPSPPQLPEDRPLVLPEEIIRARPPVAANIVGDIEGVAFRQARNYTLARRKPGDVLWIVIHTAECGEVDNAAENLAAWAAGEQAPKASWHYAIDSNSTTQSVREKDIAWHAPGANGKGIGIEHAGRAKQQAKDWDDVYSRLVLERSAALVADLCKRWKIPAEQLSPTHLRAGLPGICGHHDVSVAFGKSTHTDPGVHFPWDEYIEDVRLHLRNGAKEDEA